MRHKEHALLENRHGNLQHVDHAIQYTDSGVDLATALDSSSGVEMCSMWIM